jgi:YD repeat-containing protein
MHKATGHVASLTYPSGNRIDIAYDAAGRPSSLTLLAVDGTTSAPLLTQISYRPFGAVRAAEPGATAHRPVRTNTSGSSISREN